MNIVVRVLRAFAIVLAVGLGVATAVTAAEPPVTALAFAPDGSLLVGSQAGIEQLRWPDLQPLRTIPTRLPHVTQLVFASDGHRLLAAGGSPAQWGAVELFAWPDGTPEADSAPHADLIYGAAWNHDGLVTAGGDGVVMNWDESTWRPRQRLEGHSKAVLSAVILSGHDTFVTGGVDQSIRVWNLADGRLQRTLTNHTAAVMALATAPSGTARNPYMVSAGADRTVRLWQPTIGRMVRFVRLEAIPRCLAWTHDGRFVVAGADDGKLRLIDPQRSEVVHEVPVFDESWIYCLAIASGQSADNDAYEVAVGGDRGTIVRAVLNPSR